jgi:hypothetical protein
VGPSPLLLAIRERAECQRRARQYDAFVPEILTGARRLCARPRSAVGRLRLRDLDGRASLLRLTDPHDVSVQSDGSRALSPARASVARGGFAMSSRAASVLRSPPLWFDDARRRIGDPERRCRIVLAAMECGLRLFQRWTANSAFRPCPCGHVAWLAILLDDMLVRRGRLQGTRKLVPRGLEPRTLRLLAIRSNQLSYETTDELSAVGSPIVRARWSVPRAQLLACNLRHRAPKSSLASDRSRPSRRAAIAGPSATMRERSHRQCPASARAECPRSVCCAAQLAVGPKPA